MKVPSDEDSDEDFMEGYSEADLKANEGFDSEPDPRYHPPTEVPNV